jgi:hypothetical protein
MEMCEVLMSLHGGELVMGCLRLDCFNLDHFGHYLLDFNQSLALSRRVRSGASASDIGAFVAPEVVVVLHDTTRMKDYDFDGLVGYLWSLGCVLVILLTGNEQLALRWSGDGYRQKKLMLGSNPHVLCPLQSFIFHF